MNKARFFLASHMGAPAQALTSEAMDELSIEIRKRLLAATAWQEALSEYAKATRLAVALVDSEGQLIGELFNPQPLWVLLTKSARPAGPCPFSVSAPSSFCKCVSDTLTGGKPVIAKDPSGLVHFSVPLILNRQRVGAVVAGQALISTQKLSNWKNWQNDCALIRPRFGSSPERRRPSGPLRCKFTLTCWRHFLTP